LFGLCSGRRSGDVGGKGGGGGGGGASGGGVMSVQQASVGDTHLVTAQRRGYEAACSIGLTLIGGNFVGIFVRSVALSSCLGGPKGLRVGDQILRVRSLSQLS